MGKLKANLLVAGRNAGETVMARMMRIDDIKTDPDLAGLFKQHEQTVEEIAANIKANDYDISQPVTVYEDAGEYYIADGHTRLRAAQLAGLYEIPVTVKAFADKQAAMLYAFERQALRRNLADGEILSIAMTLGKRKEYDGTGRAAEHLARRLGTSYSKIIRSRKVAYGASDEDLKAIQDGEKSINQIYNKLKETKPKAAAAAGEEPDEEEEAPDITISSGEAAGEPDYGQERPSAPEAIAEAPEEGGGADRDDGKSYKQIGYEIFTDAGRLKYFLEHDEGLKGNDAVEKALKLAGKIVRSALRLQGGAAIRHRVA